MKKHILALGAALCLLTGCAPTAAPVESEPSSPPATSTPTPEASAPPAEALPSVYTDWSKLTPYEQEEPLYSWSDHYCGSDPLQAWDGYGTLLPYVGAGLFVENYFDVKIPLYGLMTSRGELVTAPVYANISVQNGFLLLYRGTDALYDDLWADWEDLNLTVAASDGSWVRDAAEHYYFTSFEENGGLLALGNRNGGFTFLDTTGETVATFPAEGFEPYLGSSFTWSRESGPWITWLYDGLIYIESYDYLGLSEDYSLYLYLDLATEQILEELPDGYPEERIYDDRGEFKEFPGYLAEAGSDLQDPITGTVYYERYREDGCDLLDKDGHVLWQDFKELYLGFSIVMDGKLALWPECWNSSGGFSCFSWYDLESGECIFRYPLAGNSD